MSSPVPLAGGGCMPLHILFPMFFPVVMREGGVRMGNDKGSTALPRSNSAADKGSEDSV